MEPGLWAKFAAALTNFARRVSGNPYLRETTAPGPLPPPVGRRHPYILPVPPGTGDAKPPPIPVPQPVAAVGLRLMAMANARRARDRTAALVWDDSLARAALAQANVCARAGRPTHDSPDGAAMRTRFNRAGYPTDTWIGENADESPRDDPDFAEGQWERSAPHLDNIRNPRFRHFGAAEVTGPGGAFFVECFGGPAF